MNWGRPQPDESCRAQREVETGALGTGHVGHPGSRPSTTTYSGRVAAHVSSPENLNDEIFRLKVSQSLTIKDERAAVERTALWLFSRDLVSHDGASVR